MFTEVIHFLFGRPDLLPVGSPAPPFTLDNQDKRPVSLKDFAGRPVVLWFYPKANSPG
jgi:peroxiredoxin Q/BCP